MSFAAMRWAWQQPLTPSTKAVLVALAWHADEHGYCWPSQARLARFTGLSEKTVGRATQELRRRGLVRSQKRVADTGTTRSNEYFLACAQPDTVSPPTGHGVGSLPPDGPAPRGHPDRQKVISNPQESSLKKLEDQRRVAEEAAEAYWRDQPPAPDREAWLSRLGRRQGE